MTRPSLARRAAAAVLAAALGACASLDVSSVVKKPEVQVIGVEIERLSFDEAALRLDLKVSNPNGVGVDLDGFSYRLTIEGNELAKGRVEQKVALAARGSSVIPVPVSFRYDALLATVQALADKDETGYEITVGLVFRVPVLDRVEATVTHKGTLPVAHMPRLRVAELRLQGLSLSGASLVLGLELANPNGFGLSLSGLDYSFAAAGQKWATGASARTIQIGAHQSGRLEIPIALDFASIGRSIRDALSGTAPVAYSLSARLAVGTTLPLLKSTTLPIELSGQVTISR